MARGPDTASRERLFARLLLLYPGSYRLRFGGAMEETFRMELLDARSRGWPSVSLLWLRTVRDALILGMLERLAEWSERMLSVLGLASPSPQSPSKRNTMESLLNDVRYALRGAWKNPLFSLAVVFTLALGLGANTVVFSLVNGILLKPLPYADAERVVGVWYTSPVITALDRVRQSPATYVHFRESSEAYEEFGLAESRSMTVDSDDGPPQRVRAALVTPSMFEVLGVNVAVGRNLIEEDQLPGAEPVVILDHDFWQSRLGGANDVIGRDLVIDGVTRQIVGVLSRNVDFPDRQTEFWVPLTVDLANPATSSFIYTGYGRAKPGVTPVSLEEDFQRVLRGLPERFPEAFPAQLLENARFKGLFVNLKDEMVGGVRLVLWIVFGSVGVILLMAAANVANLFLVRNESRTRETAIRTALGAGGGTLTRYLMVESTLYALAGGMGGLALSWLGLRVMQSTAPAALPRLAEVQLDWRVFLFALGLSVAVGLIFGATPILRPRIASLAAALRDGGRAVGGSLPAVRLRNALVIGQVALALVLLMNSGLLFRSFQSLKRVDPGFRSENVLGLRLYLPPRDYPDMERVALAYESMLDQIRALPGVESASAVTHLPLRDRRIFLPYQFEDYPAEQDEIPEAFLTKAVAGDYFETLGMPILKGRALGRSDRQGATDAVVISEAMAKRFWPGESPVGRRIRIGSETGDQEPGRWLTIVGVVGSVRDRSLSDPPANLVYLPMLPEYEEEGVRFREMSLAIRGENLDRMVPAVRSVVNRFDSQLPLFDIRDMETVRADAAASTRLTLLLLGVAASVALVLGAVGLYGVLAYVVSRRFREIGVRMALGARAGSVWFMVVRQAMTLSLIGLLAGAGAVLISSNLLASLLYGVEPNDPVTLVSVATILLLVTLLSSSIPASRAARVDPLITMRSD